MQFGKTIISLTTSAAVIFGLLAVPVTVVRADDTITQDNTDTGNNSTNKNKAKVKRQKTTTKKTKAKVKNNVTASATTGGNKSKNNTNGGSVDSGDVTGTVGLTNDVNQLADGECCCNGDVTEVDIDQTNKDTGNNSTNINKAKVKDTQVCKNITKAKVKNNVSLSGNTGGNKATGNTNSGNVDSGDVTFGITIGNTVN